MDHKENIIVISTGTIIKVFLTAIFLYVLFFLKELVLVVLMSVVIASAVEPMTKWFVARKIPRLLSVILIYLTLASILAFSVFFLLLPLLSESATVLKTLPSYLSSNSFETNNFISDQPFVSGLKNSININDILSQINTFIDSLNLGAFNTVVSVSGGFLSFVLMIVLSFYLSVDEDGVSKFLRAIIPLKHEKYALSLWKRSQVKIGLWMQGQLVLALIIGMLVFLGLTLIGVKNALLLAFLAAVFEIIPLFGPILAAIPAVALSFVSGGISSAVVVIGLYLIIHQFENHLIYPLVVKKVTGVSPIVSIVALVAGFELSGLLGIILSVPVATVFIEFFEDLERDKIEKIERMSK
jgi:predicted PurR-regulated permease PerM